MSPTATEAASRALPVVIICCVLLIAGCQSVTDADVTSTQTPDGLVAGIEPNGTLDAEAIADAHVQSSGASPTP